MVSFTSRMPQILLSAFAHNVREPLRLLSFYHVITSEPARSSYQTVQGLQSNLWRFLRSSGINVRLAILCMKLSRNIVLLICAVVITITSIGMNSFSLFLKPIEVEF